MRCLHLDAIIPVISLASYDTRQDGRLSFWFLICRSLTDGLSVVLSLYIGYPNTCVMVCRLLVCLNKRQINLHSLNCG